MSGSGSMLHAISTMKNNMALRRTKRENKRNKNLTSDPKKTEYNFAKVSDEELEKIKIEIRLKAKKIRRIYAISFAVMLLISFYLLYNFYYGI